MSSDPYHWTKPLLIVAGSHEQARRYADRAGLRRGQYQYVDLYRLVRGYTYPEVVLVGTWRERPAAELQEIVFGLLPMRPKARDETGRYVSLRNALAPRQQR